MNIVQFPRNAAMPRQLGAMPVEPEANDAKLDKQTLLIMHLVVELMATREQLNKARPR